ncbi:MAG TPA: ATP-binding protein, partial [Polyangiaceae bacterium]
CAGLLGFAKLGPPVADDVVLSEVVGRACSLVRPMYRERGHELKSQVQPSLRVRGNSILLDQIFVNLLVNAAEASREPIHVLLECEPLPRGAKDEPARVRISVSDDGPGVPPSLRESIFHPFFTTHTDGSGLGLTTAREAARDMGGDLFLEPTERGARFVAVLLGGESREPR